MLLPGLLAAVSLLRWVYCGGPTAWPTAAMYCRQLAGRLSIHRLDLKERKRERETVWMEKYTAAHSASFGYRVRRRNKTGLDLDVIQIIH